MMHLFLWALCYCVIFSAIGCAPVIKNIQPQINSLVNANRSSAALNLLSEGPSVYGQNNELLYWLDRGMAYHLSGDYLKSSDAFEQAKRIFDELYTIFISKRLSSYAVNDYWESYRGEDFEYILINIFQAFNYMALNQWDEAVVEARDIDGKLRLIDARYGKTEKFFYRDDPAARLLAGLLWEALPQQEGVDDAYISLSKSYDGYVKSWTPHLGINIPDLLKTYLLKTARIARPETYSQWRSDLSAVKPDLAEDLIKLVVIVYTGYVPVKTADFIMIPAGRFVTQVSFPRLTDRMSDVAKVMLRATNNGRVIEEEIPLFYPVGTVAKKVLESRKAMLMTKAIVRPLGKMVLEQAADYQLRQQGHETAASILNIVGSVYNIYSEQADLRSWQTLPCDIRLGILGLSRGEWDIELLYYDQSGALLNQEGLGKYLLEQNTSHSIIHRNYN